MWTRFFSRHSIAPSQMKSILLFCWMVWGFQGCANSNSTPDRSPASGQNHSQKLKKGDELHLLYKEALKEIRRGIAGPAFQKVEQKGEAFPLRAHVYWQMAESLEQKGKHLQAARLYQGLLKRKSPLWTKKRLLYRIGRAYHHGQKKRLAKRFLRSSIRHKATEVRENAFRSLTERRAAAKALLLYQSLLPQIQSCIHLGQVWMRFAETKEAKQARVDWWKRCHTGNLLKEPKLHKQRIQAINHSIASGRNKAETRGVLRDLSRRRFQRRLKRRLRKRYKKQTSKLLVQWQLRWGSAKSTYRALGKHAKSLSRRRRSAPLYQRAKSVLYRGKIGSFRRLARRIRRGRRYCRGLAFLDLGDFYVQRGYYKRARKSYKKAWRYWRRYRRGHRILFRQGLLAFRQKRWKRAQRYFYRAHRKQNKNSGYLYWLARSEEKRGRRRSASQRYQKLFQQDSFHYYGMLANKRLGHLGKKQPLPIKLGSFPTPSFSTLQVSSTQKKKLIILKQFGTQELYLLELAHSIHQASSQALHAHMLLFQEQQKYSHSFVSFHTHQKKLWKLLRSKGKPHIAQLLLAYPQKSWEWLQKTSRRTGVKMPLLAAFVLYLNTLSPHAKQTVGYPFPLQWPSEFCKAPTGTHEQPLKKLIQAFQENLRSLSDPGLALSATLQPKQVQWLFRKAASTSKSSPTDWKQEYLPKAIKRFWQHYWLYKRLYL